MRRAYIIVLLSLSACGPNHEQVIKEICIPINNDEKLKLEDLAKAKGYNPDEVQSICAKYLRDEVARVANETRDLGGKSKSPYDAN